MWERLSERARIALDLAEEIARDGGEAMVVPEHLLAAFLRMPDSGAVAALHRYGVRIDELAGELAELWRSDLPRRVTVTQDPSLARILSLAFVESKGRDADRIGTEHLLLAMTRTGRNPVALRLARVGITPEVLDHALRMPADFDAQKSLGMGLVAVSHRRGSLDVLALLALADIPVGALTPENRALVATLRAELEFSLLHEPVPVGSPHALGEALAGAAALAAERRETLQSAHVVVVVGRFEGTRLREVVQRQELAPDGLFGLLV
ncbi:MAG: Clp protease N-terminal domain-containing protein [Fimbriimonas sp.]